jgi:hypothetical protein
MSPEQAAGRIDQQGPAADIWSLGATLYALLTGRPPFAGPDVAAVLRQVQAGAFPPARQVKLDTPPALDAVCRKALALRPEDRYATALELGAEVERWLGDEPVRAWPEPWRVRGGRWARRRPLLALWLSVCGVAYLLVLALGVIVLGKGGAGVGEVFPVFVALLLLVFFFGMSLAGQLAAAVGAGLGFVLDRVLPRAGEGKAVGGRWAPVGARVGLAVGAALGYAGVWAYMPTQFVGLQQAAAVFPVRSIVVAGPVLGAGVGWLVGARKSARARGSVFGGLAGAVLAIILAFSLAGVFLVSRQPDPELLRRVNHDRLARGLVGLGRHAEAVRAAREYARAFPDQPAVAHEAACFLAGCVPLAKGDPQLAPAERQRLADEYGRLAVEQLREAVRLGYQDLHHLRTDQDLEALRDRQDFRELLVELEAKKP